MTFSTWFMEYLPVAIYFFGGSCFLQGVLGKVRTDKAVSKYWEINGERPEPESSPYLQVLMRRAVLHSVEIVGGVLILIFARLLQLH